MNYNNDLWTGDNKSYCMLKDNSVVKCQLISFDGKNIKKNKTPGNEIVKVIIKDQRIFKNDILYCVKLYSKENDDLYHTRASLILPDGEPE